MAGRDEHHDRLIDVLLREQLGAEQPPDLEDRILAHACPSRRRHWALPVTAVAATAAVLLVVALVLMVVPKSPQRAVPNRLPPLLVHATTTAASRRLISAKVRVPIDNVRPFRVPEAIPIPAGRPSIPSFCLRVPQFVLPITTPKKRSPS